MNVSVFQLVRFFSAEAFLSCPLLVFLASNQAERDAGKSTAWEHLSKGPVPSAPGNSSVGTEPHRAAVMSIIKLKEKGSLDLEPKPSTRARD